MYRRSGRAASAPSNGETMHFVVGNEHLWGRAPYGPARERTAHEEQITFSSIKIVLYSVYVPLSAITLFKNNAATRQVELCFMQVCYTTSLGNQPLQAFKLARGLPFRKEMSSTVYPHGCGWARSVSTCMVHLVSSCIHTPPMRGCVREIQT